MKKLFENMGKRIKDRLDKLAEENQKIYGGKKLDCCTINKRPVQSPANRRTVQKARQ